MSGWLDFLSERAQAGVRFSGAGDWVTDWQYPRNTALWIASIEWTNTAAPTGNLYVEMNNDSVIPPDAAQNIVLNLPVGTPGTYGAWPVVAAVADKAAVFIKSPAPAMRVGYIRTGGGAASQFRVVFSIRAS